MSDWREFLVEDEPRVAEIVRGLRRVAVLGIKTEAQAGQPAFSVPQYLHSAGVEVVPVPVYYPDVTHILGQRAYRTLREVPGPIDVVDVFRRPADVPGHLDDLLAMAPHPHVVWLQSGIRNDAVAEALAKAGIAVVQNRCLMVDHARWVR
jgi:hypothetical protein